jgi:hypothetical protein
VEQKRLGRGNTALGSVFADGHHLAQNRFIGGFLMTPAGTTSRIATSALREARCPRRLSIADAIVLSIV